MQLTKQASPVEKALWFIESHFREPLTLDQIADASAVSRYHLARAFSSSTGYSVLQFARMRRLSEAAKALSDGARDILELALASGYSSHEAFTRAFRDQFDCTPESVRANSNLTTTKLLEPFTMNESLLNNLAAPRIEDGPTLLIAGLMERYNAETCARIPAQWQKFQPYLGHVPGQVGKKAYGVICNGDDAGNMEYICGVEVSDFAKLAPELAQLRIPPQKYLVFAHDDHISTIRSVWFTIWNQALPQSSFEVSGGPEFELYPEHFDGATGYGGFEIWIPIKP